MIPEARMRPFFGCKKSLLIKLQSFDREIEFEFNLNKFTIGNKFY